jgi:hypothetical protein
MKKKKGLLIVIGILLLCLLLGIYIFLKKQNESEETAAEEDTTSEIMAVSESDISQLTFQMDEGEETWVQSEDSWKLSEDDKFPADSSSISTLTANLASIQADRTLEDIKSLSDYGLDNPTNVIKIEKTDGSTEKITVGSKNPSTSDTYIYINDDQSKVYTVTTDFASLFTGSIYDFAVGESYPAVTSTAIQKIEVNKGDNSYVVESNGDSSTGWTVTDEKDNSQEADATKAGTLQTTIAGLAYAGYYDYNCSDWSKYGLEDPKMEIHVEYTEEAAEEADNADTEVNADAGTDTDADASADAETDTDAASTNADVSTDAGMDSADAEVSADTDAGTDSADAEADSTDTDAGTDTTTITVKKNLVLYVGELNEADGNYYVRLDDSSEVHGISQSTLDTLMNGKAFDYWKTSIGSISLANLDHLKVTYAGETYTLKRVVTSSEAEDTKDTSDEAGTEDASDTSDEAGTGDAADTSEETGTEDETSTGDAADTSDEASTEDTETVTTYYVNDVEVDSTKFQDFYRSALSMTCQSRLEKNKTSGDPELVLDYTGTDGSEVSITYTSRDSNFYTVEDQDNNSGLVNKMNVKDLIDKLVVLTKDV